MAALVTEKAPQDLRGLRRLACVAGFARTTELTSYRAIGLMTTDNKVYERGLVRKLRSVAKGGELQGIKKPGVDA